MVQDCPHCGFKDTEVKPGGAMSAKGKRVTLKVNSTDDMRRDVLKVLFPFLHVFSCGIAHGFYLQLLYASRTRPAFQFPRLN
jgi:bacillopeptidase F (M6 metalloprotease family)